MAIHVTEQLRTFLLSILLGLGAGVLYDLLRAVRLRHPRLTAPLDLLYCQAVGLAVFLFVLRQSDGQLRGFILLGGLGGGVLFFSLLSRPLRPVWDFWMDRWMELFQFLSLPGRFCAAVCKKFAFQAKTSFIFSGNTLQYILKEYGSPFAKEGCPMAKPVKPAKKKKSGNLLVHVVILLLLATVGWRLYALQGQVRAAQAERDQYARQVENVQQENETLRSDIAEGPTEEKMKELAREELGMIDSNSYLFLDRSN